MSPRRKKKPQRFLGGFVHGTRYGHERTELGITDRL